MVIDEDTIKARIIHLLKIYPQISPSMMQIGLGGHFPAAKWKPILYDLIKRKIVVEEFKTDLSVAGRNQTYAILSLNQHTAEPAETAEPTETIKSTEA